ncbi:hypothetical protein [Variovorax sp. CY25R-8]|uniref:hypothetical protein n=1 Tax=Variovorax sp. CY25R-8 TaxID=2855501 RepID=UPI0021BADBB3|nr:hypothetical protein [Variovorax sp. CY25R-8]MCT8174375.1 hypothetical protein [Variovorax sp. CY25R-8]
MAKKILTIGLTVAGDEVTYELFSSKTSLLDWDIVIFRPAINHYWSSYTDRYQGKPCLDDTNSFQLKEDCEHWRREIKQAVEAGKTVFVYLPEVQEVFIGTGTKEFSGTGRNARATRHVKSWSNYSALPFDLAPTNASGSAMKLASLKAEILAPYWAEFSSESSYNVVLPDNQVIPSILTKSGDKAVGAIIRSKSTSGALVLLPDMNFIQPQFFRTKGDDQYWTAKGQQFSHRVIASLLQIDKALHSATEITPEPEWATSEKFVLASEAVFRAKLLEAERAVEQAQKAKEDIQEKLMGAGRLRGLLFEKGRALEFAIIDALQVLGFKAESYKDSESEFDVVFESKEGRLLGEAEGKDSKAINVDKLRQLSMNILEDLQREEVASAAKGVLFGNGFRLLPPGERSEQFTEKCISAAKTNSTALVATSDLFIAAQYLSEKFDRRYAKKCRDAILSGVALVKFPDPTPPVKTIATKKASLTKTSVGNTTQEE